VAVVLVVFDALAAQPGGKLLAQRAAAGDRPALSRALVPLPWPRACGPTWAAPGS
jgi:hypothetical protein